MTNVGKALCGLVMIGCMTATVHAQSLIIVDDLPGTFIDISQTGTALDLRGNRVANIITTIGNVVFPAGRVVVGNNGGLGFDPVDDNLAPLNEMIPSLNAFGGSRSAVAFWDNIGNTIGDVYWEEQDDVLIVQWHDNTFEGSEDTSRFQVQIFDGADFIVAQYIYDDIEQDSAGGGVSATIGFQNGPAPAGPGDFNDFQWSFDTAGAVGDGTVLSLVIPAPGAAAVLVLGVLIGSRRRRS